MSGPWTTDDREIEYQKLVAERKKCDACAPRLCNPSSVADGVYDSDEIGPYARWQGNLRARLLLVGQDFADVETFERIEGWPGANVSTNLTLVKLMSEAGIRIQPPAIHQPDDQVFFTNAVLCLKQGSMSAHVPTRCFRTCGKKFLRRTIEIVKPRVVVLVGSCAVRSLEAAFDLQPRLHFRELVTCTEPLSLASGVAVFAVYHPSPRTQAMRSFEHQVEDWRRVGRWLKRAP